jgi:hypothetical protein
MENDKKNISKKELSLEEWRMALRTPPPYKNKKKYTRKGKHKSKD